MLCGIETDASKPICGVVAEEACDEAVGSFMKGNGDDHWDRQDCHQIDCVSAHEFPDAFEAMLFLSRSKVDRIMQIVARYDDRHSRDASFTLPIDRDRRSGAIGYRCIC